MHVNSLPKYPQEQNPNTYLHIYNCAEWSDMSAAVKTAVGLYATHYGHTPLTCYLNPAHEGTASLLLVIYDARIPMSCVAFEVSMG